MTHPATTLSTSLALWGLTPAERAILFDYFGTVRPDPLEGIDTTLPDPERPWGIEVDPPSLEDATLALAAAVARILLVGIQPKLPGWGEEGRDAWALRNRPRADQPRLLLSVVWEVNMAGEWPESFYLTWVPEHNRYVVTGSTDTTDAWGVTDRALGHFGPTPNPASEAEALLKTVFQGEYFREDPWSKVLKVGLVSDPWALAAATWPESDELPPGYRSWEHEEEEDEEG